MELPQHTQDYVADRVARGRFRSRTAKTVTVTLRGLCRHVPDGEPLAAGHIEAWLAATKMAPATARTRLSQVRSFCTWMVRHGHLATDPSLFIDSPRTPRYVPRGLRHDAVAAGLAVAPDARARLIILLMCQEGQRTCSGPAPICEMSKPPSATSACPPRSGICRGQSGRSRRRWGDGPTDAEPGR